MGLPWFMHIHAGHNTLVGVFPTPAGTFVRSSGEGAVEVSWYPMGHDFPGGAGREVGRVYKGSSDQPNEQELEQAVVGFMHAHPVLAMNTSYDPPAGALLDWARQGSGILATYESEIGLFFSISHGGITTIEFLPTGDAGKRETVAVLAETCDEYTLAARIDHRVRRRIALAQAAAGRGAS